MAGKENDMHRDKKNRHILACAGMIGFLVAFLCGVRTDADESQTSIGEIPLCDLGTATFQGFMGGLYPNGMNTRPDEHEAAGVWIAQNRIKPLNASGEPDPDGKIVMTSVGVSHTTMVFEVDGSNAFKPRADADPSKNPQLMIVDGASSGHPTAQWLGNTPLWDGQDPWHILNQRLAAAGVTPKQVQVVWLMSIGGFSDAKEAMPFPQTAKNRQAGMEALVRALKNRFPNLLLAYTSQRPYCYSDPVKGLAPEPLTYCSSFGDKWMIENQINGAGDLNFDPRKGKAVAPWLSWGPYQWADGVNPRCDGLVRLPSDFLARSWGNPDWAHPSHAGVRKEADQLLAFFKTDPTATPWFLRKTTQPPDPSAGAEPLNGIAPMIMNFSAEAAGLNGIIDIVRTFDDGCYSISPNPTKTFYVPGTYNVHVTATDAKGNTASRTVTVKVGGVSSPPAKVEHYPPARVPPPGHEGPPVRITSPEDGAKFVNPGNILITADAYGRDGTVTRVDFFKGGDDSKQELSEYGAWRVWLGNATKPPYSATWHWNPTLEYNPPGGNFILTARAVDSLGAVAESSVNVNISSEGWTKDADSREVILEEGVYLGGFAVNRPEGTDLAKHPLPTCAADEAKVKTAAVYLERTIAPPESSRVPKPLRQGEFLSPQSISALVISPDGRQLAVTTMAFRHDHNFWVLAEDGRVLWGRYLEPWAPGQVAFLPHGKRFAVGLAYSRFTDPNPTLAFFDNEDDAPIYGCDDAWELGWMRYGAGDWRTGWMASPLADMLTATEGGLFTTPFHLGDKATEKPGQWCRRPKFGRRAWRMAASADGRVLVCGYFVADNSKSQVEGVASLESPGVTLAAIDATTGMVRWKAKAISPAFKVALPPEPTDEFRPLADDFHMTSSAMVPFRVALSVAASRDAGRAACTEYGGYARIGQERIHPNWSPRHPLWLCPRQRGTLRVFGAEGEELARAALPEQGLFEVHLSPDGSLAWCVPMSWFARGLAGCPWLPADDKVNRVFVFELARQQWSMSWQFPDAVSDFALHPQGQVALASCWDGKLYLVRYDGTVQATIEVGGPARLRWSDDGQFAVAGTQQGEIYRVESDGRIAWRVSLPVRQAPPPAEPLKPVFEGIPIYRVGRVGPEHAYVGDIWLIKTPQGSILVDSGGTSGVSLTLERIKAAGVDPRQIHYLLLSHTHGDHIGGAYLWRGMGAKVVAPAPAAFPATWMVPTLNHYGIWIPCAIDQPLPIASPGDTTHFTLDGLDIQAIFVPGHSFDSVVYVLNLAGQRVFLTGDIGFHGNSHILNRCWGDVPKARRVMEILRERILPLKPDIIFTGHDEHSNGVEYWQDILRSTEEAIREAETKRNQ